MPTENKYEVNETLIRFYIVRAWSFGSRPVRQSCFTLDPPLSNGHECSGGGGTLNAME